VSESGIIKQEKENTKNKIELVLTMAMKIQNTLLKESMNSQWDFESIITMMKKDIEATFGSSMSYEIDNVISNISS
jgi:hypothetical protein